MWQNLGMSLAAGLAAGPLCFLHCGAFHLAYLGPRVDRGRRGVLAFGVVLLAGRLLAYVVLGLCVGMIAGSGLPLPAPWVLRFLAGVLLLAAAWAGPLWGGHCGGRRRGEGAAAWGGAFALGLVTGLSPCPPLLASGVIALQSHGPLAGVLTFLAFFAGSSAFLVPILFGVAALPVRVRAMVRRGGRFVAFAAAVYAFALAASQFPGFAGEVVRGVGDAPSASGRLGGDPGPSPVDGPWAAVPPPAPAGVKPLYSKQRLKELLTEATVQRLGLSLHEAMHYTKLEGGRVQCQLCPRGCLLKNGERGLCRVRCNIDGTLRALTYGLPVSIHADPIEKKPLYHVLPGSTALSVATVGCNSGCVFCQNYEISQASPEDVPRRPVSPAKLVEAAVLRGDEGIAYTYTEPTVFFEYMLDMARLARAQGLRNYWITCGQIRQGPLLELCKVLDAANVDLKGFSDAFYVEYCDFHLAPVLETIRTLHREGVAVEITNLIIPGGNDDPEMIRSMCRWIREELGPDVPLHFSRFHPAYKLTRRPATPMATLVRAREMALAEGLKHVYIGNARVEGASDTRCAGCGAVLLRREGYLVVENRLRNGACPDCGAPPRGIWK
ncbi:MAG: AmmeMemoRadiSam system radical SAM enzyme [Lentisphaeria bacterium]|nr:AmmeMemoRadiSam system radical SAM enzyme [Lentisphaeria bacterium]